MKFFSRRFLILCFVSSVMIVFIILQGLLYHCFIYENNCFLPLVIQSFGINYACHVVFTLDFMHHCNLRNVWPVKMLCFLQRLFVDDCNGNLLDCPQLLTFLHSPKILFRLHFAFLGKNFEMVLCLWSPVIEFVHVTTAFLLKIHIIFNTSKYPIT